VTSTPQHHIIKETSDTLSYLLQEEFKRAGYKRVHIIEEAPKPEAIEGKLPACSVYLYQVSLDEEGLDGHIRDEIIEMPDENGVMQEFRRRFPLWVRLDYLISTWAQQPEDEQLLLGLAIRAVMEHPALLGEQLQGKTFAPDFELNVLLSTRLDEGTLARFWGSLNQPVRPALQAWTSIPIVPEKIEPFKRVQERQIAYKNTVDPAAEPEIGPAREGVSKMSFRARKVVKSTITEDDGS
jgi:Pvc16 N-terminal domain